MLFFLLQQLASTITLVLQANQLNICADAGDYVKPTKTADSNKTNSVKKIIMTQGKNKQIQ